MLTGSGSGSAVVVTVVVVLAVVVAAVASAVVVSAALVVTSFSRSVPEGELTPPQPDSSRVAATATEISFVLVFIVMTSDER